MGCSASRLDTLLAKAIEDPSFSLSSHHSSFSSSSATAATSSSSSSSSTSANSSVIPKPRSLTTPLVHHPAIRKGDTHHLVSLTSTTYGSLIVVDNHASAVDGGDFSGQSSPDSVINTWELMEGLEEEAEEEFNHEFGNDFKLKSLNSCDFDDTQKKPTLRLGLNFTDSVKKLSDSYVFVEMPQPKVEEGELDSNLNSKPLWQLLSEESLLSKMDPNVASSYQKALSAKNLGCNTSMRMNNPVGSSPFSPKITKSVDSGAVVSKLCGDDDDVGKVKVGGCKDKIVLYFTSVRGIRKTYEDCSAVRLILRGCRVMVDEKDISMDSTYKKELQRALGGKAFSLPQLFIRGKHIGGADEIKQLHENGELERLLDGFPIQDCGFECESCGDARFVPCSNCYGSRKVFLEDEGRTSRCPDCNENGLVRCPGCCS
ncbi:uncharacterized protein At5g39865-like [Chenopodium quinoa]|uniref:uncharacterized protein At5g39865-like n=1 Tax=Chenopodium quinoa TaxID=63459 RepID=UPI000B77602F|nr:uncharacterized protein At5g39865-like [Chenopodium quinoa]